MKNLVQEKTVIRKAKDNTFLDDKQREVFYDRSYMSFARSWNILVVDDSEDIRELLSIILHSEGIVYTAINGLDALSKFAYNHFDVIVSDIEMPVMNGIELYNNVPPVYKDCFLFFSGTMNKDYISYMSTNNLMLFKKPNDIFKLHNAVQQKLQKSYLVNANN